MMARGKRRGTLPDSGTLSPNPWDLTLSRQNVLNWTALERRIGLRRDATRAPIQGPEWQGAAPILESSQTQPQTSSEISLLRAKNGLDNGDHFIALRLEFDRRWPILHLAVAVLPAQGALDEESERIIIGMLVEGFPPNNVLDWESITQLPSS